VTTAGWAYLFWDAHQMANLRSCCVPQGTSYRGSELVMLGVMWTIMMAAMMLPSAAAAVLLFAGLSRSRRAAARPYVPAALFALGYLLVWTVFSIAATLAQWGLHETALLSPGMVATSPILGGTLLIVAGLFQLTPLKQACLRHCRSPLQFLMTDWREGRAGAILMGVRHGWQCATCCWALMALLFVLGVMNLLWVGALTLFVIVEKAVPRGAMIGRVAGVFLIVWGAWMVFEGRR
jgi:predicted metal-binding membrane protein